MKTSMIAVGSFATVVLAQNWPSNFPECGRNCVTNMMGQAAALGCPDASDAGCLCNNVNFLYGMRDCSQQSCANNPGDAAQVVNFGANYCAQQGVVVTYPSIPATISEGAPSPTATVFATTSNPIGAGGSAASSALSSASGAASSAASGAVSSASGALSSASGALSSASGALSSAIGSASSAVGSATSAAGSHVSAIVSTVTSDGSTFPTTIGSTTILGGAAGAVSSFVSTVTDGGSSFVTTIVSTASGSSDVTETSAVSTAPVVSTISSDGSAVGTTTVGSTTLQQTTTRAATDASSAPTSSSAGNFAAQKTAAPVGILAAAGLAALFI